MFLFTRRLFMQIENVYIDYSLSFDSDLNIMNGSGNIKSFLYEDSEDEESIGFISFNYYNVYELGENDNLIYSADGVSEDELYMVSTVQNSDFELEYGGKLVTLDQIMIDEEYYTEELEQMVLKEFIHYCSYMVFDYILVIACKPITAKSESREIIEFPQIKLYKQFNFVNIGGSENRAPVMIKNLNYVD
jgi:hypothetical protein